ncbi:hypothetical protein [Listeria cornellensis]|uniref:Uncharacterized protein n=1 Tax=Listeria cornellensis FSL F6-0969 TaxID=1265820 RepID=W7C066_9LIST|nr:hypothetical protein [Listeria cornellensis]EUJ32784.1 hypothetical protein PCORN_00585 [Listeria cornellensis FSL F6-0969]
MSKKIQLPSGRLAEHAKEIGSSANDISFHLQPTMSYSTSSARQLVQSSMDAAHMIQAMPEAFKKGRTKSEKCRADICRLRERDGGHVE